MTMLFTEGRWRWTGISLLTIILLLGWYNYWFPLHLLEIACVISGLVCSVLAIEERIANFPIGIINSLCFMAFFFSMRLYGNMGLNFIFLLLGIHGWYVWTRKTSGNALPVTHITRGELLALPVLTIAATCAFVWFLRQVQAAAPILDALSTVLAMYGQYLLNRKRVENWFIGGVSVIIAITLFAQQGLWLTAGLYVCYFVLCILGLLSWRRQADTPVSPPPAPIPTPL